MKKTIIITDITKVRKGDRAWFEGCDCGFDVIDTNMGTTSPLAVIDPLNGYKSWGRSCQFKFAVHKVEEPEWPNPHDIELHVYIGSDGKRYIYNPIDEDDATPWVAEGRYAYHSRESMEADYRDELPLTELKFVPAKDDDNEQ